MACKYIKKKINGSFECKLSKFKKPFADCYNCVDFCYTNIKPNTIKKVSYGLIEKQKKRFSIIYHNLDVCCSCGLKRGNNSVIDLNEVYEGSRRQASMVNGFVIPLCRQCHTRYHNDRQFALKYKKMFQVEFEKTHTRDEFLDLIHKNYL